MKTRAELLADLEEERIKNNKIKEKPEVFSHSMGDAGGGYDPYNNPGLSQPRFDGTEVRRRIANRRLSRR